MVDIRLFTDEEARAYLTERLDRHRTRSERLTEADELIADLDRLPLALAQAASYMLDRDLTCAQYRQRLAKRRLELVFPADAPADEYAQTVAVAWSLSLEVASDLPPRGLALPVMSMASVLSPNGIPTDLFSAPAALAFLTQVNIVETASEEPVDRDDVHDTLSNLHRLSLLSRAETVRVHALVQRATLEQLDDDLADSAGRAAADALVEIWAEQDYQPEYALLAQSLRDNTDALHHARPDPLWLPDTHPVLVRTLRSLEDSGQQRRAVDYATTMLEGSEQRLGPDHRDTAIARGNVALTLLRAGRPKEAVPLQEHALRECERVLGSNDVATVTNRSNLASAYQAAGRLDKALPLYEQDVADRERMHGPEHPQTLMSRMNLAHAYQSARQLVEALPLHERNLVDSERVLGPEHSETLTCRNNLAWAYADLGRLQEALTLFQQNLRSKDRLFGHNHPSTVLSRSNVAVTYQALGRLDRAAAT